MCDHTPGPWQLLWDAKNGQAVIQGKRLDGDVNGFGFGDVVAIDVADDNLTGKMFPPTSKESCANARLVAAAPDLLEALEEIISDFDNGNMRHVRESITDLGRPAIHKARGTNNG